jgi:hypothetical protein
MANLSQLLGRSALLADPDPYQFRVQGRCEASDRVLRVRSSDRPSPCRAALAVGLAAALAASVAVAQPPPQLPPDKPGFPVNLVGQGALSFTGPIVADFGLSSDGTDSIVFGTDHGELWIVRKLNNGVWAPAPGFPVAVGNFIASSPAVGNLVGDGTPEIVVGHGDPATTGPGGVKAYRADGSLVWSVDSLNTLPGNGSDPVRGTPAIGDLDGDGINEVVWGGFDHHLHVVDGRTGTPKPGGWPKDMRDTIWSSPALHDIDGDGLPDIVIGRDAHAEGTPVNTPDGGCIHVFRHDGDWVEGFPWTHGSSPPGLFPKCIGQTIFSAPAVGDIDGDGLPEIVHGTGAFYKPPSHSPPEEIFAWNCDGSPAQGWPAPIRGQSWGSPALANLDADPELEVVVTADNSLSAGGLFHVYALDNDGSQIFEAVPRDYFGVNLSAGNPVVGDVLGPDEEIEILVPSNGSVVVFSLDGTQLTDDGSHAMGALSFLSAGTLYATAAVDFESDGAMIEVLAVVGTFNSGGNDTRIHVWNPVPRSEPSPWGFIRAEPQRRGVAPGTPTCAGSGGCGGDAFEPDDTAGTASPIASASPQSHSLCPAGDEDWVTFTLGQESAVTVETSGPAGDTRMWLYDSGLDQIEFDDDDGPGLFSRIDRECGVDALPEGTYYVEVGEVLGDELASYSLTYAKGPNCEPCPSGLTLSGTTISGTRSYRASGLVTLGPSLVIEATAIDVLAGDRVVIRSGTEIGGSFAAGTNEAACSL